MKGDPQLIFWKGDFGKQYLKRNSLNSEKINESEKVFKRILGGLQLNSILEVGSNVGINLSGIRRAFGKNMDLYAVEPFEEAYRQLLSNQEINLKEALNCSAFEIPFEDNSIDLVFTNGVLIHINPNKLKDAMSEIVRVSKKYVLCSEYFSQNEEEIIYRGQKGYLFKRDFGKHYLENFPNLKTVSYGFLWQEEFPSFDNLNWWLFEKIQNI
ncbi:methyltransferase type 11 [Candidatus Pacearchaeota archaeon CG10_big_fil_rev_8_21_14_0_10_32_42]|nr:MAG: methyltransferase type 11 [Candidatus Pacearchaeota archaeon CG10_big_fil_rev_8_21_14_0_10_32_42]